MQEKKEINIEIGARIKAEREKAGLTQERFSELIGLGISFATLKKICQVMSVSSDAILFGKKNEEQNQASDLAARLERLSPEEYEIAKDVIFKLFEAFSLNK